MWDNFISHKNRERSSTPKKTQCTDNASDDLEFVTPCEETPCAPYQCVDQQLGFPGWIVYEHGNWPMKLNAPSQGVDNRLGDSGVVVYDNETYLLIQEPTQLYDH
ncbi:hypothetical protein UPYG_G00123650 [Umbra pygmaea]|uniref:Uncharacterized protein n=1 Tax=Umbra pygmaea TaxID=75934 RepID=A0ABD0X5L3_UMBPY